MFHWDDMGDELRISVFDRTIMTLQIRFEDQRSEQSSQLLPRLCIQSDERIVHNQKASGRKKQRFGELELPVTSLDKVMIYLSNRVERWNIS